MVKKLMILVLLITSLLGYLEWGGNHKMFLFQVESELLVKLFHDPLAVLHPFTILPLLGQVLLAIAFFRPQKWLILGGIACIGVLMLLILTIGILGLNWKSGLSSLPFLIVSALLLRQIFRTSPTG